MARRRLTDAEILTQIPAARARERVIDFQPIIALPPVDAFGANRRAHIPAVQKLMIHIHQIFMHERVMRCDVAV